MYSQKVIEQFMHPKNMGRLAKADGIGKVGNILCGDMMTLYIEVKKEKGKEMISNIKFESFGCAAAIATSSMITEMVKGRSLDEAANIDQNKVAKELGGLPPIKMHCSNLAAQALHKAIEDYRNKKSPKN